MNIKKLATAIICTALLAVTIPVMAQMSIHMDENSIRVEGRRSAIESGKDGIIIESDTRDPNFNQNSQNYQNSQNSNQRTIQQNSNQRNIRRDSEDFGRSEDKIRELCAPSHNPESPTNCLNRQIRQNQNIYQDEIQGDIENINLNRDTNITDSPQSSDRIQPQIQQSTISLSLSELKTPQILKITTPRGTTELSGQIKLDGEAIQTIRNKGTQINLSAYLTTGRHILEISGNYSPSNSSVKVEFTGPNIQNIQETGGNGEFAQTLIINVIDRQ